MPEWLTILLDTGEFLAFGLYFLLLASLARRQNTDMQHQISSKLWMYIEFILFISFTALFFSIGAEGLPHTIYGVLYLLSIIIAIVVTIQMGKTVEPLS